MDRFRRVDEPQMHAGAVTVCVAEDAGGGAAATLIVPGQGQSAPMPVPAALSAARVALSANGLAEIVVWLARRDLWQDAWGTLAPAGGLSDREAYDLAVASDADDDA